MKKLNVLIKVLLVIGVVFVVGEAFGQQPGSGFFPESIDSRLLPANFNPTEVDPDDIPNEEVLRAMGASDDQIRQAMAIKYGVEKDTTFEDNISNISKDLLDMEDSTLTEVEDELTDSLKIQVESDIYGHNVFFNGKLSLYDKAKDAIAAENYVLGSGDEINVAVWGFSYYNKKLLLNSDGYVNVDHIGRIYLKGLTFGKAKALLKRKFSKHLNLDNSTIEISLNYSRVISVNIVGEVTNPGSYKIPAVNTAFNALVAAGGPTEIGSVRNIFIKRAGVTIDTLDVYEFLMDPGKNDGIFLQHDDYIFVPVADRLVSIEGQVKRPMKYELVGSEGMNMLLNYSGGLSAAAYTEIAQVTRYGFNEQVLLDVSLDSLFSSNKDFDLHDGDEVMVKEIPEGYMNNVKALGSLRLPGDYQLRVGDRVSDILEKAEGATIHAYLDRAYIIRLNPDFTKSYITINLKKVMNDVNSNDNIELQKFDELLVLSKVDFEDEFVVSVFGDVRKPGDFIYGSGLSLKDVLLMAGGLKKEAANNRIEVSRIVDYNKESNQLVPVRAVVQTIEINNDLSLNSDAEEYVLQPFDRVMVRTNPNYEPPQNVVLNGEVEYPGTYSILQKDETIVELIERAGGLTDYAFLEGLTMNRADLGTVYVNLEKALRRPNSKFNLVLYDGDEINIPKSLDLVTITGAVGTIDKVDVSAPFLGRRAGYYVRNFSGSFSAKSLKRKTSVIYPSGIVKSTRGFGIFNLYPRVERGCKIVVPEKEKKERRKSKEPLDLNGIFTAATGTITTILTLWILLDRASQ